MSAAVTEILRDAYMGRLTSIRTVQLLAGMDNLTAARCCCVSPHTFRRWRSAGYVPWPGWPGWEVHDGLLFPPGERHGLEPEQVAVVRFLLALSRSYRRSPIP